VRILVDMRIGTAGWSIPLRAAAAFPGEGSHLARYSRVFDCAEINSSFHRSHRPAVYERWAAQTPAAFRFSAKLPRAITHEGRLRGARPILERFLDEAGALGDRLTVLLVQLPPSLSFETRPVRAFFELAHRAFDGAIVCEPRHPSWFTPASDAVLAAAQVGRVATDPLRSPAAARPGGWLGPGGDGRGAVVYHRWHGVPTTYRSPYEPAWISAHASELASWPPQADVWCIFDNTASGAAAVNALELREAVGAQSGG